MNIDSFKPAIVYTIYIAATPEKVWRAIRAASDHTADRVWR